MARLTYIENVVRISISDLLFTAKAGAKVARPVVKVSLQEDAERTVVASPKVTPRVFETIIFRRYPLIRRDKVRELFGRWVVWIEVLLTVVI